MVTRLALKTIILAGILFSTVWSPAVQCAEKLTKLIVGYSADQSGFIDALYAR